MKTEQIGSLQNLDYLAIGIYLMLVAGIGLVLGRYIKNVGDYFKGGNAIPWVSGSISNFMTKFSTFIFVAYAGIAYQDGIIALTIIWSTVTPTVLGAIYFAKRWRRAGVITPMEYLETRFNSPVRQIFSWGGVLFKILDNMVRLYALGIFLKVATGFSLEASILVCGVIVAMYTIVGGLWAVVITDVIQFIVLIVATAILVPLTLNAAGGFPKLMQTIPSHFDWFNGAKGTPLFISAYYLMVLIKYSGNWTFIQRFYSVRDERASQKQALLTALFFLVFPTIFLFPSLAAKAIIPKLENPEMAYVAICLKILPEGAMGLMIAAMFGATMSVLSGEYNVTAGVLTKDIYQRLFSKNASEKELLLVGRIMTFLLGAMITVGALFVGGFGGAFEANKLFTGLFAIPMTVPLVLGIVLKRPQPWGALATVLVGTALGLALNKFSTLSWEAATWVQIVACILVFLSSGLGVVKAKKGYQSRVEAFFTKLATPLKQSEIPRENKDFQRSMNRIYAASLAITGFLFIAMSIPSVRQTSGLLCIVAGIICVVLSVVLGYLSRKRSGGPSTENEQEHVDLPGSAKTLS